MDSECLVLTFYAIGKISLPPKAKTVALGHAMQAQNSTTTTKTTNNWKLDITNCSLSHPQIAYELIEAWGAEDTLQVQNLSIDGLNNSKDTTVQ